MTQLFPTGFSNIPWLMLSVLTAGCVSPIHIDRQGYPTDWPSIAPMTQACPDLSGIYSNVDLGPHAIHLASWALPNTTYPLERIDRVQLSGPAHGIVHVRLLKHPDVEVTAREWHDGVDFRCDQGWMALRLPGLAQPIPLVIGSFQPRFTRTIDGQLVVEVNERGAGVVLIMPFLSEYRHWHRYPLAVKASPGDGK